MTLTQSRVASKAGVDLASTTRATDVGDACFRGATAADDDAFASPIGGIGVVGATLTTDGKVLAALTGDGRLAETLRPWT